MLTAGSQRESTGQFRSRYSIYQKLIWLWHAEIGLPVVTHFGSVRSGWTGTVTVFHYFTNKKTP